MAPSFDRQYRFIYTSRLQSLERKIVQKAGDYCSEHGISHRKSLAEIKKGEECFVAGVIYLDTLMKRNVLHEIMTDTPMTDTTGKYINEGAVFYLEDHSGRARLQLDCTQKHLVTGVVAGVHVVCSVPSELSVVAFVFAGPAPQSAMPVLSPANIVFVSGLHFGGKNQEALLRFKLLAETLEKMAATHNVSEIVFLGSVFDTPGIAVEKKYGQTPEFDASQFAILDQRIAALAGHMKGIYIVPGLEDPTNSLLPQEPIHRRFFPAASEHGNVHLLSNPAFFSVDEIQVLCVSGQIIDDMERYFVSSDALEIMQKTIQWQQIAPTAPDTLPCYPLESEDPFVLKESPHIYVASSRSTFECRETIKDGCCVRYASLTDFSSTGNVFLFNKQNREFTKLEIKL